ncbi:MAG: transcriptional regulator, MarR family-like protein [Caulobacteraceae bacterium]|nr:transcriptional regulator, MarR family-like protein [Caulobacteraceae bacterium]
MVDDKDILHVEGLLTFRLTALLFKVRGGVINDLKSYGVAEREWRVLALIANYEPITASELIAVRPLDKASVSRAVASLVERKYVVAVSHPTDGRARTLQLTKQGRELYEKLAPASIARNERVLSVLTDDEREQLFATFDKLYAHVERLQGGAKTR